MKGGIPWLPSFAACACVAITGCADTTPYLTQHRDAGTRQELDLSVEETKEAVAAVTSYHNAGRSFPVVVTPRDETSFDYLVRADSDIRCIIDVFAMPGNADRSRVKALCQSVAGRWGEDKVLQTVTDAAARLRLSKGSKAPSGLGKDELQDVVRAAVKSAMSAQRPESASGSPASDVDRPNYARAERPEDFAVVVGVENYASLPRARFAARDAQALRDHLLALGYPARNIMVLTDRDATRAGLSKVLNSWLPNRVKDDSTVFFYYSGHGAPDPRSSLAYLLPIDGDPEYLEDTAYPLKSLYDRLEALNARRVIVALDSCFSGAGGRSVLAKDARPLVGKIDLGVRATGKVVTLSASKSDQISGALDDQGHGVFTYYLLKGLNGGAQDSAGRVTLRTLYEYLSPKVADAARLSNRNQEPQLLPAVGEALDARLR